MTKTSSPIRTLWEASPLARRPHFCSVCGHPIAIGTRYHRIVFVDKDARDQTRTVVKFHTVCPREMLE